MVGKDSTYDIGGLEKREHRWVGETSVPAGSYEVILEAFIGTLRTRIGATHIDITSSYLQEVVVPLRWVVPERFRVSSRQSVPHESSQRADLTWQFSDLDRWAGIEIERREAGGVFTRVTLALIELETKSFRDSTVTPGTTYEYRIAAVDSIGALGDWSQVISIDVGIISDPPPGRLDNVVVLQPRDDLDLATLSGEVYDTWLAIQRQDGVYLVRPDGTGLRRAGDGRVIGWSPTGELLAIQDGTSGYAVSASTDRIHPLYDSGRFSSWSPYGMQILHHDWKITSTDFGSVWLVDVESGETTRLAEGTPDLWSPDGRWIVHHTDPLRGQSVDAPSHTFFYDMETGESTLRFKGSVHSFSPDGQWLLYLGGGDGWFRYQLLDMETGQATFLGLSQQFTATWSPDSQSIVASFPHWVRIVVFGVDGSSTPLAEGSPEFAWSPRGDRIAFVLREDQFGDNELPPFVHTILPDGTDERRVSGIIETLVGWSPDGSLLAVTAVDSATGKSTVYLVDPESGSRARVAAGDRAYWSP
ncbi:MAG: hypothetical protein HN712_15475 [Gemmatimonadetes bacterium]|nr:hypothetical protein [Gemmatimonadota bacterium]